jgi:hypothetical protein
MTEKKIQPILRCFSFNFDNAQAITVEEPSKSFIFYFSCSVTLFQIGFGLFVFKDLLALHTFGHSSAKDRSVKRKNRCRSQQIQSGTYINIELYLKGKAKI